MKYIFVGRTVYMSDVYQILKDENYPFTAKIDSSVKKELTIKADTFYCDTKNDEKYSIPGISEMDIITRSTNGDGCWFLFYHGEMKKNYEKEQARPGLDGGFNGEAGTPGTKGIDGTDGLHGTQVSIFQMEGRGMINFVTSAADGTQGQIGGDGGNGGKGKDGYDKTFNCEDVDTEPGDTKECETKSTRGEDGGKGGKGGNAGEGGRPGNGGNAGSLKVYMPNGNRFLFLKTFKDFVGTSYQVSSCAGRGAKIWSQGKAGKGGNGGKRTCGNNCKIEEVLGLLFPVPYCKLKSTNCGTSGSKGDDGVSIRECKKTNPGTEYRGTVSKTISGLTCQDWKSQSPHKHNNTPLNSPKAGLFKNYCRNPDNKAKGPWCYTTSKEKVYEHCDVKLCDSKTKWPVPGKDGEFDTKSLRSLVYIINTASNYDEEIFQLMVRTGEDEYIKGQTNHAKNIFNAILRVVPGDNKDVKNYVELLIKRINLGLNFFGYKPTYVPDRSWKDIQDELHKVLTNAEKESKSVNSILEKIERNSVLSDKFKQVESLNILPFEKELDETKKLIELQQSLKKKTIKDIQEIEDIMKRYQDLFEKQLKTAVNAQKRRQAIATAQFMFAIVGWGVNFAQKDPSFIGGVVNEVNDYIDNAGKRPSDKCFRSLKDLKEIGKAGMEFSTVIPKDPFATDLTKLDAPSTIALQKGPTGDGVSVCHDLRAWSNQCTHQVINEKLLSKEFHFETTDHK